MTHSQIRDLNDRFRRQRHGNGKILITAGIEAMGPLFVVETICAVRSFDAFTPDNDPYGQHDFGVVVVRGMRVFWKIDLYDQTLTAGSEDPADESVTCRVLTVMLPEEY